MSSNSETTALRPGKRAVEPMGSARSSKTSDKSTRVSHACELCREKRARCNGERPTCQRCAKLGAECQYGLAKNDRRRKEIEDLQRRITEYEGLFESLACKLEGDAKEKLLALRESFLSSDSTSRSDHEPSSSGQVMSPPDLVHGLESNSSGSGSSGVPNYARPTQIPLSQVVSPFQSFPSPDQLSPKQRQPSSILSQQSTPSLTLSVMEWQRGFIYAATEGVLPPRDVTERAVKAFFVGSSVLFENFEKDEMDDFFRAVYERPPSPGRTVALCQLCMIAAVGCQHDWEQFPDETAKSYLAIAKLYLEDIIETHALSAMRVMSLLGMYFSFEKRMSSLAYVDSGLAIARAQQLETMPTTPETRKWKRTWYSLIFHSNWISATVGRYPELANLNFHPSMLDGGITSSMADEFQFEMCKVAHLTGRILVDVYHTSTVDTNVVNMYKAELESWLFGLPGFMRIDSLLANGNHEIPMRPVFLVHLLYLTAMVLIYRRVLSEFADRPDSLISNTTMEDVKNHLDACLWSSRQVSRILNVAMLNRSVVRKCWMFIHATYCASNILLFFAAKKLLVNPGSESVAEDIMASEQCIRTLEYCAPADESAQHFLKHVKPLHIALSQMHMVSKMTAPRDVVPISNLVTDYLEAPRQNIPVGDDLAQLQRSVVSSIQTLLKSPEERARMQGRSTGRRHSSSSSYPDPETGMPIPYPSGDSAHSLADSLQNYFWDDSLGLQAFKNEY